MKTYCFTVDDNIRFLKELTEQKPESIFCHPYPALYRKLHEKYGLKVWLCVEHHVGQRGVHNNSDLSMQLKKLAQTKFEEVYGANKCFRDIFGKNYLEEENKND